MSSVVAPDFERRQSRVASLFEEAHLRPRSRPLRETLGLALAVLLLGVSLALSWGLAAYAKRALLQIGHENLESLAAQMARELSFGMDRFAREIELQASGPGFNDLATPPTVLRSRLEAIQKIYPEYAHVSVVEVPSGNVIAATKGIFEGGNGKGRPVFEEGQKSLFVADFHDAVKLAALLPRPASGEPLRFLDVAAPVRAASGHTIRVLGAHLSWEWTQTIKQSVLAPVEARRKVQLMLVDTSGKVMLPPGSAIPVGTSLAEAMGEAQSDTTKPWADGQAYLMAEAPTFASGSFKGLGWRIVARQPLSVALATSERLGNYFLAGGLLVGLLAAALGWLVAARLVRPVSEFASTAAGLQPGTNVPLTPTGDEPQEVAQVREAFHRVTGDALRRAEALLDELNAIYEGAPVALAVVDRDGRYLRANRVWCEAFADGSHLLPGQAIGDGKAPPALLAAMHSARDASTPLATEIDLIDEAGPRAWQCVLAPLRDKSEHVVGVSAVATDVTEIRLAERELRALDRRKDEFVSMLAHELRNPLAPIMNAIEILDRHPTEEQAARMRSMIRNQAKLMARLVDDLLDIARVNLGKIALRIEPVSVRDICQAAVDSVAHGVQAKGMRLDLAIDERLPEIRADKFRLQQVVCNLMSNAIRYGREGGRVSLSAGLHGDGIAISVEDDGVGISAEFLPHVFDLFAQERPTSHLMTQGGLGIGLALVKKLAELHGGRAVASSAGPGKGSQFRITLPLARELESKPQRAPESADQRFVGAK